MLTERNILRYSVLLELFFGITGILVALYSDSRTVMLDGGYSLLCTLIMQANVTVARIVKLPSSASRPYGSATLEPLMLLFEALILLTLCIILFATAVYQICIGGNTPAFGVALVYEVFSTLVGGATSITFLYLYRRIPSPLIYFEYQEWLVDASVSATATVAFFLAFIIGDTHPVTPYIDSVLTLLLLAYLIRLPVRTLRKNLRQVMLKDIAEPQLIRTLEQVLAPSTSAIGLQHCQTSMVWLGRWLWVDIAIDMKEKGSKPTLDDIQQLRTVAERSLDSMANYYRLSIVLQAPDQPAAHKKTS